MSIPTTFAGILTAIIANSRLVRIRKPGRRSSKATGA
jgi:hypothetical protein